MSFKDKEKSYLKIWNINDFECLQYFSFNNYKIDACLLSHITGNYIALVNKLFQIFVFNYKKFLLKKINTEYNNNFIISYYDSIESKNYIIVGTDYSVDSYDFNSNLLYQRYQEYNQKNFSKHNLILNDKEKIIKIIDCDYAKYIRIWDFHSGKLLMKIYISSEYNININSLCLWNNNFLFIGTFNKILLINLKYGMIEDELLGHNNVNCIQKIIHPELGECLISQGLIEDFIFLRKVN